MNKNLIKILEEVEEMIKNNNKYKNKILCKIHIQIN
jgi:hypothetical protein